MLSVKNRRVDPNWKSGYQEPTEHATPSHLKQASEKMIPPPPLHVHFQIAPQETQPPVEGPRHLCQSMIVFLAAEVVSN